MEPSIEQKREIVQQEFMRRQSQLGASSAGIGAEATNNPQSGLPRDQMTSPPPMPSGGVEGAPSDQAVGRMKEEKGESQKLTEALIWRMKRLTDQGK